MRFPARVWAVVIGLFLFAYLFLFIVVHPYIDTRTCAAILPDPLFELIPFDKRWFKISHELFYVVTAATVVGLTLQSVKGEHRPFLRFGLGISLQAFMRALTLVLTPLCRVTETPGTAPLAAMPTLDLGFVAIPWRTWATNDLMFSGHAGEFLILSLAVWSTWPRLASVGLIVFQLLQALALIGSRGHYTIDVVVAIPFALVADRLAVTILTRWQPPPARR